MFYINSVSHLPLPWIHLSTCTIFFYVRLLFQCYMFLQRNIATIWPWLKALVKWLQHFDATTGQQCGTILHYVQRPYLLRKCLTEVKLDATFMQHRSQHFHTIMFVLIVIVLLTGNAYFIFIYMYIYIYLFIYQ